jgi:hypothetical protein
VELGPVALVEHGCRGRKEPLQDEKTVSAPQ